MKKIALTFAIFLGVTSYVSAFVAPTKPTGYVNDYANVLQLDTKNQLEEILRAFAASTTNEIAVVIIPDLGGDTIEHYAIKLFELWKIGNAKNDNGVLLLVAINDRKVRIEVGYGLEGALPDITAKNIIETQITPAFKRADYSLGILQGVRAIVEATRGEYMSTGKVSNSFDFSVLEFILFVGFFLLQFFSAILARSKSWWAGGIMGGVLGTIVTFFGIFGVTLLFGSIITVVLVVLGLLFDYIVSNAYTSSVTRGGGIPWWAGGGSGRSSGGSFGGFGGGSSGGGGASGSW
jgi:uncharacterized protein